MKKSGAVWEISLPFTHGQFYLGDDTLDWDPSTIWDGVSPTQWVHWMKEAVAIAPQRVSGFVLVRVLLNHLAHTMPNDAQEDGHLLVPSGTLRLCSPAIDVDAASPLHVPPGMYTVSVVRHAPPDFRARIAAGQAAPDALAGMTRPFVSPIPDQLRSYDWYEITLSPAPDTAE